MCLLKDDVIKVRIELDGTLDKRPSLVSGLNVNINGVLLG